MFSKFDAYIERVNLGLVVLAIIITAVSALVSVIPGFKGAAVYGVLVSIFILIVSHIFFAFVWRVNTSFELSKVLDLYSSNQAAEIVGSYDDLMDSLKSDIVKARDVINTSVAISESFNRDRDRKVQEIELYSLWLERGRGVWLDIIGIKEFFSSIYTNVSPKKYSDESKIKVCILKPYLPIINFTIIDTDNYSIVYFGWDKMRAGNARVFKSQNEDVVQMFRNYSRLLQQYSYANDEGAYEVGFGDCNDGNVRGWVNETGFVDKKGVWLNVSYEIVNGKINYLSVGRVKIAFDVNKPIVSVEVYRRDGRESEYLQHDKNRTFLFDKNSILIKYDGVNTSRGYCVYEFDSMKFSDRKSYIMRGFYTDERFHGAVKILGINIDIGDDYLKNGNVFSDEYFAKSISYLEGEGVIEHELSNLN